MSYSFDMKNGQRLEFENEGGQTYVAVTSAGWGQNQSQSHGFSTGEWSKPPALYRLKDELILEIHAAEGSRFMAIGENQVDAMAGSPDLSRAEVLRLEQLPEGRRSHRMKPMEPMKPLKPMAPMKPLKAMGS